MDLIDIRALPDPKALVTVIYTNYRGEIAVRRIRPMRVYFGATEYHPEPQWLVEAMDIDKEAIRIFALRDMRPA